MPFRNPLTGTYEIVNGAFLTERSHRQSDLRLEYYEAILTSKTFEHYYAKVGGLVVKPTTTSYKVNADMEVKYMLRRGWIAVTS